MMPITRLGSSRSGASACAIVGKCTVARARSTIKALPTEFLPVSHGSVTVASRGQIIETLDDLGFQAFESFAIVQVGLKSDCAKVEGNVIDGLGDLNHLASECVGDARLVKDIGVSRTQVRYHNLGSPDQVDNVINYVVVYPDVVSSLASHSGPGGRLLQSCINTVESSVERHHNCYEVSFGGNFYWESKDLGFKGRS